MRLVFMGTPQFAVPTLQRLCDAGLTPALVYSQPVRGVGRG
ncbi:MAG: methionyl-tRNA formyltransferase, partial [Candidatus Eisenbacteria bacterium]|nr:methionyl-tRNA formyltransferase [Candidatus Eisenbacteria bacterium]